MDKYIFLDFDGVITTRQSRYDLDPEKCKLIQKIVDATGAKIIITSSWRKNTLEATIEMLKTVDGHRIPSVVSWINDVVGITIRAYQYLAKGTDIHLGIPRGVEIKQWIDTHVHSTNGKNFNYKEVGVDFQYVILDDDSDMLYEHRKHFIKTNTYKGLSLAQAKKAIKILNTELSIINKNK